MIFESLQELQGQLATFVGDVDPASAQGRKRRRLLDAALERFTVNGYRKASIDEVARQAGVAKGTVYLYFATKAELLLAVVASEKLRGLAAMEPVFEVGIDARERLRRWVTGGLVMVAGSPLLARLIGGDEDIRTAFAELDPALVAAAQTDHDVFFGALIDAAAGPGRLDDQQRRERKQVLDGLRYFAPLLRSEHVRGHLPVERFAAVLAALLIDGIAAPIGAAV
ncbi:MAG: TetR/AcrR family transcriptional regulator [Nannocystis sp.]|nr:TetR/AcrR family transcriptional regulator [Nannocystis sp.]MBA3550509.1 TetR/AcrR family transcriptional regulator [Nannocystis sp.]